MDGKFRKITDKDIEDVFKDDGPKYGIQFVGRTGAMRLKWEAIQKIFDPIVNKVLDEIEKVGKAVTLAQFNCLLLVGGFAESPYLQQKDDSRLHVLRMNCYPD